MKLIVGFSGSRFFRIQVFQDPSPGSGSRVQGPGLGPGSRVQGPGPGFWSKVQAPGPGFRSSHKKR